MANVMHMNTINKYCSAAHGLKANSFYECEAETRQD